MRLYEGEGRHEEQSGSGRQADITNRAQMMMTTMTTGMSRSSTHIVSGSKYFEHDWPLKKGDEPWRWVCNQLIFSHKELDQKSGGKVWFRENGKWKTKIRKWVENIEIIYRKILPTKQAETAQRRKLTCHFILNWRVGSWSLKQQSDQKTELISRFTYVVFTKLSATSCGLPQQMKLLICHQIDVWLCD